jgi:hypothetical protein
VVPSTLAPSLGVGHRGVKTDKRDAQNLSLASGVGMVGCVRSVETSSRNRGRSIRTIAGKRGLSRLAVLDRGDRKVARSVDRARLTTSGRVRRATCSRSSRPPDCTGSTRRARPGDRPADCARSDLAGTGREATGELKGRTAPELGRSPAPRQSPLAATGTPDEVRASDTLRCVLINGQWDNQWDEFTHYVGQRPALRLTAKPAEAIPHDAKAAGSMMTLLSGKGNLYPNGESAGGAVPVGRSEPTART